MTVAPGKVFEEPFDSLQSLEDVDFQDLHRNGYTCIKLETMPEDLHSVPFPIDILTSDEEDDPGFGENRAANFIIHKDGDVRFVVINGFMIDLLSGKGDVVNGIVR